MTPGDRPAPLTPSRGSPIVLLLMCSLAMHVAAFIAFEAPPRSMTSAGISAITVDIVIGDNSAAGLASSRGQESVVEAKPRETAPLVPEEIAPEQVRSAAVVEAKSPLTPVDATRPREETAVPAEALRVVLPTPEESETAAAQLPKPEPAQRLHDEEPPTVAIQQPTVVATERPPAARAIASAAGGVGWSGSTADANYPGRVAAHLARHKRFPPGASQRGERGSTEVDFGLDERGHVTTVRIVRSSGFASLDQAAAAMVRRASPFPPPPDRRPQRFTVPISYSIR